MINLWHRFFQALQPPTNVEKVPIENHDQLYSQYRMRVFIGIFIGYAGYYLVRKNISLMIPMLEQSYGYSKSQQGLILGATSLCYGFSKFLMGWVSDRSNAKVFLSIGLLGSAFISCLYGFFPALFGSYFLLIAMMGLNGWFQGMGWAPCGRVMVHWFSVSERGSKMAVWNVAHNVGQSIPALFISLGAASYIGWTAPMLIPGICAIIVAALSYYFVEDTPASVGLPPVEEFKGEKASQQERHVRRLTPRQEFFYYVLYNKYLWYLAFANLFIYLARYAVIDWLPSYLTQVRHFSPELAGFSYSLYELAGIPGTLLCGWLSDKYFQGRRAPAGVLFMVLVTLVLYAYWLLPNDQVVLINLCVLALGFLIYGPVMLVGLHAIDLVPKSVAGTAAGFTGLFGYVGGATCANALFGWIVDNYGWDGGFALLMVSCFAAILFLSLTWQVGKDHQAARIKIKKLPISLSFGLR